MSNSFIELMDRELETTQKWLNVVKIMEKNGVDITALANSTILNGLYVIADVNAEIINKVFDIQSALHPNENVFKTEKTKLYVV